MKQATLLELKDGSSIKTLPMNVQYVDNQVVGAVEIFLILKITKIPSHYWSSTIKQLDLSGSYAYVLIHDLIK